MIRGKQGKKALLVVFVDNVQSAQKHEPDFVHSVNCKVVCFLVK